MPRDNQLVNKELEKSLTWNKEPISKARSKLDPKFKLRVLSVGCYYKFPKRLRIKILTFATAVAGGDALRE